MLSSEKLKNCRKAAKMSVKELAGGIVRPGLNEEKACSAIKNWEQGLMRPNPTRADLDGLARALRVEANDLATWTAKHKYAPIAPRKARLVADLIRGRSVQDALDLLKFANKRAAVMISKVLQSAVANADEQEADVESLYVSEARIDEGGVRHGTRRWRPKDRGRAVSFTRLASHIIVSVDTE
jgi:large subunit ribosomal protein L22